MTLQSTRARKGKNMDKKNTSHSIFQVDTVTFAYTQKSKTCNFKTYTHTNTLARVSLNLVRLILFFFASLPVYLTYSIVSLFFGRSNLSGVLNICKG